MELSSVPVTCKVCDKEAYPGQICKYAGGFSGDTAVAAVSACMAVLLSGLFLLISSVLKIMSAENAVVSFGLILLKMHFSILCFQYLLFF